MQRVLRITVALVFLAALVVGSYQMGFQAGAAKPPLPPAVAASPQPAPTADQPAQKDAREQFETFWETWNLVEREFYNKDAIDYQKMTYGAIRGMLETLGDAHTVFADPSNSRMTEADMRGSFDGIGVTVEMKDGHLTVVAPIEDSPGARAGLRPGDVIVKVGDKDTANLTIIEAVTLIRGPRGTTVKLTVQREGEAAPLVFEIQRAEIKKVSVTGQMMDGNVAYVRVSEFADPTPKLLQQKLKELMAGNPTALVLDLRNNPGGLLGSAVDVASQFIGDGVLLYEQRRDADAEPFYARRGGLATAVPMVVLINKGSASASEIVAGAVQDRGRGVLVGEPSFGKDTVQNVHQLADQSSVRITIARWYTPKRQEISGKGLVPDIPVTLSEDDVKARRDPQLERALEKARMGS